MEAAQMAAEKLAIFASTCGETYVAPIKIGDELWIVMAEKYVSAQEMIDKYQAQIGEIKE